MKVRTCFRIVLFGLLTMNVLALPAIRHDVEVNTEAEYRDFVETPPPYAPVRAVAEFEPSSHVLIRYPLGIPTSLVVHLANTCQVICVVSNATTQNQATTTFQTAGVNMANVSFMLAATNTYWIRDYGPWFVFDGYNQMGVVDTRYNRPRPNDDEIPRTFATQYGYNLYGMNLIQTGGNYMCDGINTGSQTTLVYEENPTLTTAQINQRMLDYMGIERYFVLPDPNNTYIDHIDCWGKFLAPDKVMIRSVPTTHSQYNAIEATAQFFANQSCAWGYPYRVFRVNTPQNQPYTNSLILNKKIFVPLMNSSYDNQALTAYRNAMPGYEVIGITASGGSPWESTDALHCRTHEVPDRDMLLVKHTPYNGQVNPADNYDFNAFILAHSNSALYTDSLFVCYKVNQNAWQRMSLSPVNNHNYSASLTGFAPGDTIRYFIHAADLSGRSTDHPFTAASDPHKFWITQDNIAPLILHNAITSLQVEEFLTYVTIMAEVTDNTGVGSVVLTYKLDNGAETSVPMNLSQGNTYIAYFPVNFTLQSQHLYYKITAYDNSNPPNTSYLPLQGWFDCLIILSSADEQLTAGFGFRINSISPNPYKAIGSRQLKIVFDTKANQKVKLNIFNVKGQLVHSEQKVTKSSGQDMFLWDGKGISGLKLNPGVYFVQISADGKKDTSKVVLY